jgi:PPP family 3-phenylpropionic acid transporter
VLFGQIPVIDAFALRQAREGLFVFGPVRAVGSMMFIISNFAAGALIDWRGSETILICIVFGAIAISIAAARLPAGERAPHPPKQEADFTALRRLVAGPFGLALAASALIQGGHGFYYAFSAVAWSAQGYSDLMIGALWACGVAVEIVFLWLSGRSWLGRLSPAALLMLGGGGSILRWGLTAMAPPLWALFALQCLHALSFAATYLGFLRFAAYSVPDRYAATGQAINSALAGGVVMALASAVSGYFFAQIGTAGFAIMILPAAAGLAAAILLHRVSALPRTNKID